MLSILVTRGLATPVLPIPVLVILVLAIRALATRPLVLNVLALKAPVLKVLALTALVLKDLAPKALALKVLSPKALAFRERHCPAAPALMDGRALVAARAILSRHPHRGLALGPRAAPATNGDHGQQAVSTFYDFIRGCGSNGSGGLHGRFFW